MDKNTIYYGDGKESIYTEEGKKRLWEEENIIYIGGFCAYKIIQRKNHNPLIEVWHEDDETLYKTNDKFDAFYLNNLLELVSKTHKLVQKDLIFK